MLAPTVGIYSRESRTVRSIRDAVVELGGICDIISPKKLGVHIDSGEVNTFQAQQDYDVILNWSNFGIDSPISFLTLGTTKALASDQTTVVNGHYGPYRTRNKLVSLIELADAGIPVPPTAAGFAGGSDKTVRKKFPADVHKPLMTGGGYGVSEISDGKDDIRLFYGRDAGMFQTEIETGGEQKSDYRAFVVGDEVVLTVERSGSEDEEFKTNLSTGGNGEKVSLPQQARNIAVESTEALGVGVSGVDLIQSKSGDWYVIELNTPAGFLKTTEATGTNPAAHIAQHLLEEAGMTVSDEKTRELSRSHEISKKKEAVRETIELTDESDIRVHGKSQSVDASHAVDMGLDLPRISAKKALEIGSHIRSETHGDTYPRDRISEGEEKNLTSFRVEIGDGTYYFSAEVVSSEAVEEDLILPAYKLLEGGKPQGKQESHLDSSVLSEFAESIAAEHRRHISEVTNDLDI